MGAWAVEVVESLADPRSFARGVAYQRDGRVEMSDRHDGRVQARVRGSVPYEVELVWAKKPSWSCSCPVGESGEFCKHCVAVALEVGGLDPPTVPSRRAAPKSEPLRRYLSGLETASLIELVVEQAGSDWRLRERLTAAAIGSGGGSVDVRAWRGRIDSVFGGREFISYAEAGGWAEEVFDVIGALEDLLDAGQAPVVVGLAEHAHRRADAAVQYIDDSDGWLTDISGRLGALHLRACTTAGPDPIQLARRLADLELTSELDAFHRAAATYADVLGPMGLDEYRRIVEPEWRKAKRSKDRYAHAAFAATEAMIGVAQAGGNPDDLIAVRSGDLHTPDAYLEIARSLVAAGRSDDAVDWSRRGLETFADRHWQTPPLREFLARELRCGGDDQGAEELWWDAFERHPSLDGYRRLVAETTGDAPASSRRALQCLRDRLSDGVGQAKVRNPLLERSPATTLVEILLYEGNVDEAWQAAVDHGCDDRTWMTLARAREATHPLDVIPIYERAMKAQIDTKKNGGYRAAVDLLAGIQKLAVAAGEPQRFDNLLAVVTAEHRRKTNLMALIDKKRWS